MTHLIEHPEITTVHATRQSISTLCLAFLVTLAACGDDPTGVNAPVMVITSPVTGLTIAEGTLLRLEGDGTDFEDGAIPDDALSWSSSVDGDLGTGRALDIPSATPGLHTITLSGTDNEGNVGTATVMVDVQALDFIDGTVDDPQIGLVVNSIGSAVRLFQLGDPTQIRDIPIGASASLTPTGISVLGDWGAVPLGNAASVAILDLRAEQIDGFFFFPSGNATGSSWVNATTVVVANQETDVIGKFSPGQANDTITETLSVTQFPSSVLAISDSLILVVSSNLDDSYAPAGDGMVTGVDPRTMTLVDTVRTGGENAQVGDLGPDGMLYVINTGDYVNPSTLAVIDPSTMTRVKVVGGFPSGSGDVHVDSNGLVFVSSFFGGTVVWDSSSETFLRDGSDPVCAPIAGGGCRGAFVTHTSSDGTLYQSFFGSVADGLAPQLFVYSPGTFALTDSIDSGLSPVGLEIATFR